LAGTTTPTPSTAASSSRPRTRCSTLPLPALHGAHQIDNAALAVAAARALGIADPAIASGLTDAEWPARLQRLTAGPLAAFAQQKGADLWLDGAHNAHAAAALADWLAERARADGRPAALVAGLLANKDAAAFFAPFVPLAPAVFATPFDAPTARPAAELATAARAAGLRAEAASDLGAAVAAAARGGVRVVICGSLYLAGEALSLSPDTWPC
jgi:dihydrofolate synthase/folylpolyglutamate synthase